MRARMPMGLLLLLASVAPPSRTRSSSVRTAQDDDPMDGLCSPLPPAGNIVSVSSVAGLHSAVENASRQHRHHRRGGLPDDHAHCYHHCQPVPIPSGAGDATLGHTRAPASA